LKPSIVPGSYRRGQTQPARCRK